MFLIFTKFVDAWGEFILITNINTVEFRGSYRFLSSSNRMGKNKSREETQFLKEIFNILNCNVRKQFPKLSNISEGAIFGKSVKQFKLKFTYV